MTRGGHHANKARSACAHIMTVDRLSSDVEDLDEVRRQAHRIKGASMTTGATHIGPIAGRIETDAGEGRGDADDLRPLREQLRAVLERVADQLKPAPSQL